MYIYFVKPLITTLGWFPTKHLNVIIGWKKQFLNETIFAAWTSVWIQSFVFAAAAIFPVTENNRGDNRPSSTRRKQQWPTSKSQTTRAWHACQAARQFHFGTTVPKCTIPRKMSWTDESSCQWTAHNRGQVCFRRTRCFGSRLSQPMSTMAWHKMECHNTSMAASANTPAGLFAQRGGGLVFLSLPHERETFGLLNGNHGGGI